MKKSIFFVMLGLALASFVSAQAQGPGRNQRMAPVAESVTVSGDMVLAYGRPAIISGDTTYIVFGINRLAGFIDGLREGAYVSIDGRAVASQRDENIMFLRPTTLALGERTFELAPQREFQRQGLRDQLQGPRGGISPRGQNRLCGCGDCIPMGRFQRRAL